MSKPEIEYPNDDDGDALRRVAKLADMSKPMLLDFHILARSEAAAEACLRAVIAAGYAASKFGSDDDPDYWTVECKIEMIATYDDVVRVQQALDAIVAPHGGRSDGWGTFGNSPDNQPGRKSS